jgi:hypothetical protein
MEKEINMLEEEKKKWGGGEGEKMEGEEKVEIYIVGSSESE